MTDKFAIELAELRAEINNKFSSEVAKCESLKGPTKEKTLNLLKSKKELQIKEKTEALKKLQKEKKYVIINSYKEKIKALTKTERVSELTNKIKSAIAPIVAPPNPNPNPNPPPSKISMSPRITSSSYLGYGSRSTLCKFILLIL